MMVDFKLEANEKIDDLNNVTKKRNLRSFKLIE